MALAHAAGDSVEQAYRHTTRLSKRREMMTAWANFVLGKPASNQPLAARLNRHIPVAMF
jgi:hypothetical protein